MGEEMTWADVDALKAEREARKRELADRLTKVLVQNFDFGELRFAWYCEGDSIRIEAYERARAELFEEVIINGREDTSGHAVWAAEASDREADT